MLSPDRLVSYCGALSIEFDGARASVRCTICGATWSYAEQFDWWRCARGCSGFLLAYPASGTAARMLNAHRPSLPTDSSQEEGAAEVKLAVAPGILPVRPPAGAAVPRRGRPAG